MSTPEGTTGPTVPGESAIRELVAIAERLAREAGALVLEGRPDRVEVAATKSSPQDVVTAMDLASENLLRERLAQWRPEDGILGEEQGYEPGTSGITWVVDPIDGTVNYLYGIPAYAVSVAAVVGGPDPATWQVLAGCVHAPVDGRTFTAGLGQGAYQDGRRLRVNSAVPLELSLVGTGFGYVAERRRAQAAVVADLLPLVRDIRRIGSAALDLCTLAAGGLDAHFERGLQPWDLAAASLVAQEAGAVVRGLHGARAGSAMAVAGPEQTVERLVAFLEERGADTGP
ncbi:inositol monophosphatase family protein [Cellulomonas soli]|uniref:Inositol-1-monophosphatase n=1 Tax=Cellulomonas soli TaxID=931535 RepID=A0A512P9T9_9CELL|nr:inositol monophosphatase family protein [Cellulomonas soli]NYI60462.1 myo-inositol-1(or 4)-monophosphatase [Cellulomonas soli]GEP67977.1 inositol monophosphatase [Cellulomonas soli]